MSEKNSGELHLIVYTSIAAHKLSIKRLDELVNSARQFNSANDVTGVLVYADNVFVQALEGPRDIVKALYSGIVNDSRHHAVCTLEDGALSRRRFSDHSMSFEYAVPTEEEQSLPASAENLQSLFESRNGQELVSLLQDLNIDTESMFWA